MPWAVLALPPTQAQATPLQCCEMRIFLGILTVLFSLAALLVAPLAIAAFASINPAAPDALRLLSAVEGTLAARLHLSFDAFWRGSAYMGLACGLIWLAAYLKPR